ncbi:MAG: DoxX family protein [Bacteroidetes bacterium]|nr:DoxX family protein [Bacteroidota bacterium]
MNFIHRIERWGDAHHPKLLDLIRVTLGIFLLLKGLGFMDNTSSLKSMIENQPDLAFSAEWLMAIVYYVIFVHLVGGAMIALGLFTRFSSLMQIPIVLGAIVFINFLQSPINTDMLSSVAALALLIVFAVIGSGKWSLEWYLDNFDGRDRLA